MTDDELIDKAIARYKKHCEQNGYIYQQPSRNDCTIYHAAGERQCQWAGVQLCNANGVLAAFDLSPGGRMYLRKPK